MSNIQPHAKFISAFRSYNLERIGKQSLSRGRIQFEGILNIFPKNFCMFERKFFGEIEAAYFFFIEAKCSTFHFSNVLLYLLKLVLFRSKFFNCGKSVLNDLVQFLIQVAKQKLDINFFAHFESVDIVVLRVLAFSQLPPGLRVIAVILIIKKVFFSVNSSPLHGV